MTADLLDPGGAAEVVEGVDDLEAVVNLVGGFASGPKVEEVELEEFERMLRLNLVPAFNLARAAMPRMAERGSGSFVCVSARAALQPVLGRHGLRDGQGGGARVREGARRRVRRRWACAANAVLPSVIDTPANRESMPDADWSKWVAPAEIARVIAFLVSDESAVMSGAAVPVYGQA